MDRRLIPDPASTLTAIMRRLDVLERVGPASTVAALTVTGTLTAGTVNATTLSGSLAATNLTGTIASARLSGAYTGITGIGTVTDLTATGTITAGTFSGSGASLTSIPAGQLTGTVASARISGSYTGITGVGSLTTNVITSGYLSVTAAADASGNIRFSAANPYIVASSYIRMPGGLFVNGGTFYTANDANVRGELGNDSGSFVVKGGSSGITAWSNTGFQTTASTSGYQYVMWGTTFANIARFTSRAEVKEQITPLAASGALIDALEPVTFIPRGRDGETADEMALRLEDLQHGFIAEQVAAAAPKLATYEPDETDLIRPNGWKWPDMIAVAVAEIKHLRARVAALEENP